MPSGLTRLLRLPDTIEINQALYLEIIAERTKSDLLFEQVVSLYDYYDASNKNTWSVSFEKSNFVK